MSIKWRHSDVVKLGRAVADFNKTIDKLEELNDDVLLPNKQSYENLRRGEDAILTRSEFNRMIKSLRAITDEANQKIIELDNKIQILQWEKKELDRQARNLSREINTKLDVERAEKSGVEYVSPESREGKALIATKKLGQARYKGSYKDFLQTRKILQNYSRVDRNFLKQYQFKENYMKMLETFQAFSGYKELKDYLDSLSSSQFAKFILSNPYLEDISAMYILSLGNEEGVIFSDAEKFNEILENVGIDRNQSYNYKLINNENNEIIKFSNKKEALINEKNELNKSLKKNKYSVII